MTERRPLCRDEWCVKHHEVVPGQTICTNQYGGTFKTRDLSRSIIDTGEGAPITVEHLEGHFGGTAP